MSLFCGPKKLSFVAGQDGMKLTGQRWRQLAAQCSSSAAAVEDSVHNLEPAMEDETHGVVECEKPTAGPPSVSGMVLKDPKESGDF